MNELIRKVRCAVQYSLEVRRRTGAEGEDARQGVEVQRGQGEAGHHIIWPVTSYSAGGLGKQRRHTLLNPS